MIKRRKSKELTIGNVKIGGNAPISVQSMCNTDTRDVNSTLKQISEMAEQGCELVRIAILNKEAASAVKDIVKSLMKPGRDGRESMPMPLLKSDILKIEDLKAGMQLEGTVRNVVDFGAFVDIGVKQDGLVHLSKLSKKYVSNPRDVVAVGQIVTVWVEDVDLNRKRIQLTMVNPNE